MPFALETFPPRWQNKPKDVFGYAFFISFAFHLVFFILTFFFKPPETKILSFNVKLLEAEKRIPQEVKEKIKKSVEMVKKEKTQKITLPNSKGAHEEVLSRDESFLRDFERSLFSRTDESTMEEAILQSRRETPWETTRGSQAHAYKAKSGETVKAPEGKTGGVKWQSGYQRKMTYLPPIEYPLYFRQQGIQAEVLLSVEVDPMGRVVDVEILRSSGYSKLDIIAKNALRQARFSPLPGSTENDRGEVEIRFQLY
ncbi:MAG: TonB family protein [Leptospiraceae bacterium]|nr:TonB family protein [Leptospiraceae bacterium]MDW8306384.1 TonB family protein [Leptospiraceae bacterium]